MEQKNILQVAFDASVLKTREIILTRAGLRVDSVSGTRSALALQAPQLQSYDLVLIGRDASLAERNQIAEHFRKLRPDCKIIALHSPAQAGRVEHADINSSGEDPTEWLRVVQSMLDGKD